MSRATYHSADSGPPYTMWLLEGSFPNRQLTMILLFLFPQHLLEKTLLPQLGLPLWCLCSPPPSAPDAKATNIQVGRLPPGVFFRAVFLSAVSSSYSIPSSPPSCLFFKTQLKLYLFWKVSQAPASPERIGGPSLWPPGPYHATRPCQSQPQD